MSTAQGAAERGACELMLSLGVEHLIVICDVHGELGSIPAGGDEVARMDKFWSEHVRAVAQEVGR